MVHRSRHCSKRQRRVEGHGSPRINWSCARKEKLPSWECMQSDVGGTELTREGVGKRWQ